MRIGTRTIHSKTSLQGPSLFCCQWTPIILLWNDGHFPGARRPIQRGVGTIDHHGPPLSYVVQLRSEWWRQKAQSSPEYACLIQWEPGECTGVWSLYVYVQRTMRYRRDCSLHA